MSVTRLIGRGLLWLSLLTMIVLALVWTARKPIARTFVDAELQRRGIAARYDVVAIGPSRQRLENVVIGDPANPDLTAKWAEIVTRPGFDGVAIDRIRAGGVRLKGQYDGKQLRLGAVDRLLPPASDGPFVLPDVDVALSDARMALATPYGTIGLRIDGSGNVANRFDGQLAAVSSAASLAPACRVERPSAYVKIMTRARQISLSGPLRARAIACRGTTAEAVDINIALASDERLSALDGEFAASSRDLLFADGRADGVRGQGKWRWANGHLASEGDLAAVRLTPDAARLRPLVQSVRLADATPLAAIARTIESAVLGLGSGLDARARFAVDGSGERGQIRLTGIDLRSRSGATLRQAPGAAAWVDWPRATYGIRGEVAVAGGGFPASRIAFDGGRALAGTAIVAPLAAGGARLTLSPLRFSFASGKPAVSTHVRFDGRVGDATLTGLSLPLTIADGQISGSCFPVRLEGFRRDSLTASSLAATICRRGDLVTTGPIALRGRIGESPLAIEVADLRYDTAKTDFAADRLAVRLGGPARPTRLDLDALTGRFAAGGAAGRFASGAGQIGAVPLLLSQAGGTWRFAGGALAIDGSLRVADEAAAPRFLPLVSRNVSLLYKDGRIDAKGTLAEPFTGTAITMVTLRHDLGSASGGAVLDVPDLSFGQSLQPERLTSITLGVIANVQGRLRGRGQIDWSEQGVTSQGRFATDNLDFAAAFGPVAGLKGEIIFSDLLGLVTPPGQRVTIASINPGVAVTEGVIGYRLLPGLKLEIEEGRWPFAGGQLSLAPSLLDLNQSAERRLTFRVDGLDAALFVQQLAFDNVAVTGRFDGLLPMVFDQNGGRIEKGTLSVRESGGTLSYIGDVSNAELGRFSRLAFDALKSIRYRRLSLDLNGALDGEMVTVVRFNGVNQLPLQQSRNFFLKQFNELPFLFNITIKAPFRGLFSMVRSFNDPSMFIPRGLEALPAPPAPQAVQAKESETVQ